MNKVTSTQIENFKKFLDSHSFFFIVAHENPDGDAIYSSLAMANILEKYGKKYQLLNMGPFKRPEIKEYEDKFSSEPEFLSEPERKETGLIMLDCSEAKRIGDLSEDVKDLDTFIIDHHKTSEADPEKSIIDGSCPAACTLVQLVFEGLFGPDSLDEKTAEYLFNGFSTDTGYFRFLGPKSDDVIEMAARLVKAGANPRTTYDFITGGKPFLTRKLLGALLSKTEIYFKGQLAVTFETLEDTLKWGKEGRDSDLLYSSLLSCEGIEAVAFLRQDDENKVTGGLRSRSDVDVSEIAAVFGGGGHKNASGFACDGKLDKIMPKLIEEFGKVLK